MARAVEIVPATEAHAREMAPHMSLPDIAEVWAQANMTPLDAALYSVRESLHAWAGLIEGRIACIFGVSAAALLAADGMPWLLTTPLVNQYRITFLRHSRKMLRHFSTLYPRLTGYVDTRHTLSKAWLAWLGFTLSEAAPYGPQRLLLHRFDMGK